jgi:hypothetical protein
MNIRRNSQFFLIGLVLSLIIAVFLSPFASPDPDGLDRVAEDLQFSQRKTLTPLVINYPPPEFLMVMPSKVFPKVSPLPSPVFWELLPLSASLGVSVN